MVAVKLDNFGGMIPSSDERLLPQNRASNSENTWLYTGALEGMWGLTSVHTLADPLAKKVYRIPTGTYDKGRIADSFWIEFGNQDVDVLKTPLTNDSFERFYFCGAGLAPSYNTKARILASDPNFILGIPEPAAAPGGSVAGGVGPVEARAYVYTYVSAYGEEGPPSTPFSLTGNSDGTWNMTFSAIGALATDRNITTTRIYRTITGVAGSTSYFLVAEIPVATLAYADTVATVVVAANTQLQTTFWTAPPDDMKGFVLMANGIMAGFRENEIWFSEPYRPHAWPATYALTVEYPIVALGVIGQSVIICTANSTYAASGVNPSLMTLSRIPGLEPCSSRGSLVSTPGGVVYASPNGIVLVTPGMLQVVTRGLIGSDEWQEASEYLSPSTLRASTVGGAYYCWGSVATGCFDPDAFYTEAFLQTDFTGAYNGALVDIENQRIGFNKLRSVTEVGNCFPDPWSGETLIIKDGQVFLLDRDISSEKEPYVWRSKVMETPNQRNFGAMRVYFGTYAFTPEINPVRNVAQDQELSADQWGIVRVYADDRLVVARELRTSGEIFKLPSGFKGTYWEVEVEARVKIFSIELATTAKELGGV